jgi:hypothetical protein
MMEYLGGEDFGVGARALKNIPLSHLSVWPREAIEEIWWVLDIYSNGEVASTPVWQYAVARWDFDWPSWFGIGLGCGT